MATKPMDHEQNAAAQQNVDIASKDSKIELMFVDHVTLEGIIDLLQHLFSNDCCRCR